MKAARCCTPALVGTQEYSGRRWRDVGPRAGRICYRALSCLKLPKDRPGSHVEELNNPGLAASRHGPAVGAEGAAIRLQHARRAGLGSECNMARCGGVGRPLGWKRAGELGRETHRFLEAGDCLLQRLSRALIDENLQQRRRVRRGSERRRSAQQLGAMACAKWPSCSARRR